MFVCLCFMGFSCAGGIMGSWPGGPMKGGRSYKFLGIFD